MGFGSTSSPVLTACSRGCWHCSGEDVARAHPLAALQLDTTTLLPSFLPSKDITVLLSRHNNPTYHFLIAQFSQSSKAFCGIKDTLCITHQCGLSPMQKFRIGNHCAKFPAILPTFEFLHSSVSTSLCSYQQVTG
jgi:hypothetical protein